MKRVLTILPLLALIALVSACPKQPLIMAQPAAPKVIIGEPVVYAISQENMLVQLAITVSDPQKTSASMDGLSYNLDVGGKSLARGQEAVTKTQAHVDGQVLINFTLPYEQLKGIIETSARDGRVPFRLSGYAAYTNKAGHQQTTFTKEGTLPALLPPELDQVGIEVRKLTKLGADLSLMIVMRNLNQFEMPMQDFRYELMIDDQPFHNGVAPAKVMDKMTQCPLAAPFAVNFAETGKWARDRIRSGKASYTLKYEAVYLIDGHPVTQKEEWKGELAFVRPARMAAR